MQVLCVVIAVICSLIAASEQASLNQNDKFRALVLGNGEAPAYTIVERRAANIEVRRYRPVVRASSVSFIANASAVTEADIAGESAKHMAKLDVYYAGYNNASLVMPTTGLQIFTYARANASGEYF